MVVPINYKVDYLIMSVVKHQEDSDENNRAQGFITTFGSETSVCKEHQIVDFLHGEGPRTASAGYDTIDPRMFHTFILITALTGPRATTSATTAPAISVAAALGTLFSDYRVGGHNRLVFKVQVVCVLFSGTYTSNQ